jgi:DNA-binding transcriptional LysR family regulator
MFMVAPECVIEAITIPASRQGDKIGKFTITLKLDYTMNDLKPYAVFAETVSAGSMSAAARRLGMSPSAVSQTIRALETQAGVTLLHRSTRKLTLTEAGARCYPHCLRLLEAANAASDSLLQARDAPSGELRVAAPVGFGAHIAPALAPVLAAWPQLRLRLLVDDAMIDLIGERIDIAIRAGRLPDSSWIARPLCQFEMILCAAPAYLARHGVPATPDALTGHHWLTSTRDAIDGADRPATMVLDLYRTGDDAPLQVDVAARIVSNNQLSLHQMCEQGMGLARLGYADAHAAIERGALVRVLPQWQSAPLPVTAMTPRRDGDPAKVRLALDALRRHFAGLPGTRPA